MVDLLVLVQADRFAGWFLSSFSWIVQASSQHDWRMTEQHSSLITVLHMGCSFETEGASTDGMKQVQELSSTKLQL